MVWAPEISSGLLRFVTGPLWKFWDTYPGVLHLLSVVTAWDLDASLVSGKILYCTVSFIKGTPKSIKHS